MTSTLSRAGTPIHYPPSLATDPDGVIVPPSDETLPAIVADVEPLELLLFTRRLLDGARKRRWSIRWAAVNRQRIELARLCLDRVLAEQFGDFTVA